MDEGAQGIRKRPSVTGLICLGAAPVFAVMAVITGFGGSAEHMHHNSPLDSMPLMYGLMAVFHAAPWLRLGSRRRGER